MAHRIPLACKKRTVLHRITPKKVTLGVLWECCFEKQNSQLGFLGVLSVLLGVPFFRNHVGTMRARKIGLQEIDYQSNHLE